jgi:hypothetical protein
MSVQELKLWLTGTFNNLAQVAANKCLSTPRNFPVLMNIVPLVSESLGNVLYVEAAGFYMPQAPYRQRLYRLLQGDADSVIMEVYEISNPGAVIGAFANPERLALLASADVTQRVGCDVRWSKDSDGLRYLGSGGEGCTCLVNSPEIPEATHMLITSIVTPEMILQADQFMDAAGNIVRGPVSIETGYQYHRQIVAG